MAYGALLVFCREHSPYSTATFKLYGLEGDRKYEFTDVDTGAKSVYRGKELMEAGFEITMSQAPCSALLLYTPEPGKQS